VDTEKIMQFETEAMSQDDVAAMFVELIESGDVWRLPSSYVVTAAMLIESGVINSTDNERRMH
jgi:hypothetical protein